VKSSARTKARVAPRRNVREEIYGAALHCFEKHGVRATSMDHVAKKAGVSRPAIYYYFPDKDALVLEVVARQVREIHRRIRQKVRPGSAIDGMVEAAVQTIRISRADQYVKLLTQPDTANLTARLVESNLAMGLQRELWYPLLESARERGELRTDREFDDIIRWITFLEFSMITSGDSFDFEDEAEIREQLTAYLVPALRKPAKP
jgi:AcrR family transcriptional regulator